MADLSSEVVQQLLSKERALLTARTRDDAARRELQAVESALGRFALGTWGTCAGCGGIVDAARLRAHPETELCLHCAGN